ncbi:hypothetical protein NDU88_009357 [Pleurodeles waltl]|uniref:Uncharacterized protein n=1 Tax=Pleurodeles waltl TaxID=8319 RepID=A0AAV7RWC8_PLEWA|nr:hypothetical protein NDU88_009357 [Pleurodeles waltl]
MASLTGVSRGVAKPWSPGRKPGTRVTGASRTRPEGRSGEGRGTPNLEPCVPEEENRAPWVPGGEGPGINPAERRGDRWEPLQ